MNPTPKDFCESHDAYLENRLLALPYKTMAEIWDACPRADWLIWILEKTGQNMDSKTLRLFACWCVRETPLSDGRKVWDLLTDERSRNAVIVAERFANGEATEEERDAAWFAAPSARASSRAAGDAAYDAAWSAASNAAWSAAWAATWSVSAAKDAESRGQAFQADHFRTLFKNPFKN